MVRESRSAREAWETLQTFFVQKNLHNRVQLSKQLHDFEMPPGENLMDHLMRFEDLFLRRTGETVTDDEKQVTLLGSLPAEYDGMIKIIEAHGSVTLLDAKEMLRREYEAMKKREKQEGAFKAVAQDARKDRSRNGLEYRGGARDQGGRGQVRGVASSVCINGITRSSAGDASSATRLVISVLTALNNAMILVMTREKSYFRSMIANVHPVGCWIVAPART
ncbi:polyprotein [Plasmopara halstedii]|uniref:Polyprotein n=1 Tax=Plasmopara halstedii TaxID=4781 RepID=A0A0P1B5M7_PLAHL|nr:polyprotein [Plasmopara halstedii]CEG48993.1 polyprotein [Plasmopara halstedii]|eukprot:XP_024585362.1 polyprotein [Plasmopara halstedii]